MANRNELFHFLDSVTAELKTRNRDPWLPQEEELLQMLFFNRATVDEAVGILINERESTL